MLLSRVPGGLVFRGDTIEFPLPSEGCDIGTEILVRRGPNSRRKDLYQAPIGYFVRPKEDRRGQFYSLAEVRRGSIGISAVRLNCDIIRDYFYVAAFSSRAKEQPDFYEVLKTTPTASQAELRLAYKIRDLELRAAGASLRELKVTERAFNILAEPELRACYDRLLKDPNTPALFPYGGLGSLIVEGERSRDGKTFFARRILAFSPDRREQRFTVPLRNFCFYADRAIYRDARRTLEIIVDQAAMPLLWDATWNQWKHLLDATAEVRATFLQTGVYRIKDGEWTPVTWEKSLPSRIKVTLPPDINERIEAARRRHHIFGLHADFFARLRVRIEREPIAKSEIERLCDDAGIPGDFDVAQITWEADYSAFYYRELLKRTRTVYFFRDEFIFELERVIAIERPELGHATYLFARPSNMDDFLRLYASTTKQAIRANQDNIAEQVRFVGRINHGVKPETWLEALRVFLGGAV
ncbi:MAG: hypothetical protein EPN47_04940 [Acidobacteria bacterium]|nr:MAG: hypothetical protein EPN47_04940 [Acidobacteriota bacterium]